MTRFTIRKQFANAVADHISREMFAPHRGVIEVRSPFGGNCIIAFGNDGYSEDERTRTYVDALFEALGSQDPVMGIDTSEGYTWAIVMPVDEASVVPFLYEVIKHELYSRYHASHGPEGGLHRMAICDSEIFQHTRGMPLAIRGWESVN